MNAKPAFIVFSILSAMITILSGCNANTSGGSTIRVGMIFDSPIADDSFSLACLRGAEQAKSRFGIGLDISESLIDEETESLQRRYAATKQHDLLVCIGPGQARTTNTIFTDYPDQKFVLIDGDINDRPNVTSILSRDNESSFLAGALAAMVTTTGRIGFIGGKDIPAIHRFLAGYRAGAGYIDPSCEVLVEYSGTWLNDGKTRALALDQYDRGADVIFAPTGGGSVGVIEAAKQKGRYVIGVDADQSPQAPFNVIASTLKNVDRAVFESIKQVVEGKFRGGLQTMGLKEGEVALALNKDLPLVTPEIKARIADLEQKIIAAEIKVPES